MSDRHIYTVHSPVGDIPLTVIAESAEEAKEIAHRYNDDEEWHVNTYIAEHEDPVTVPLPRLWVAFESAQEAMCQVRDLEAAGVDVTGVWCRAVTRAAFDGDPIWWEVGAMDHEWTRLPSGVLCGGDQ
jgi:hypothetical protein